MQIKKTEKKLIETDVIIENYIECDKCKNPVEINFGDAFDFEFVVTTGESYIGGGDGRKRKMDLCQNCASDLIKLLKKNGYRIIGKNWDFN